MNKKSIHLGDFKVSRLWLCFIGVVLTGLSEAAHPYTGVLEEALRELQVSEVFFVPLPVDGDPDPEASIEFAAKDPLSENATKDLQRLLKISEMVPRKNRLAKDHSYLLFFFGKDDDEGWAIHFDVKFGKDIFNLYPAKRRPGKLVLSGSMLIREWMPKANQKDPFPFEPRILFLNLQGWEATQMHAQMMRKCSLQQNSKG